MRCRGFAVANGMASGAVDLQSTNDSRQSSVRCGSAGKLPRRWRVSVGRQRDEVDGRVNDVSARSALHGAKAPVPNGELWRTNAVSVAAGSRQRG